jgi:hypothetical protein
MLKKEKIKTELKGHVATLQIASSDAKRIRGIAERVDEIERAGVIDEATTRELALLSEEVTAIRARYRGSK